MESSTCGLSPGSLSFGMTHVGIPRSTVAGVRPLRPTAANDSAQKSETSEQETARTMCRETIGDMAHPERKLSVSSLSGAQGYETAPLSTRKAKFGARDSRHEEKIFSGQGRHPRSSHPAPTRNLWRQIPNLLILKRVRQKRRESVWAVASPTETTRDPAPAPSRA